MFIEDIRNDFYNILLGNRVLLLVHYDVDAICTCKILQELFKCDNIPYTLIPIGGIPELKTAYEENSEEVKFVVLVNCGGTLDIVDILQPEEDVVFFILDSHKPTDVCNVYSDGQVRLVYKDSEENIPNFDDIFRDDEDEEEEPAESGVEGLEALATRRRERRAWEDNRHTLMFNYTQFSYYGKPSGIVALELAWRLSRVTTEVLWCASVAAAAADETYARDGPRCLLDAESLHRHIAVAAGASADKDHAAKIVLEKDIRLPLYRMSSVWEALSLAGALAPRLHTHRGPQLLRRLLADLGIPLQQARQAYRSMDVSYRRELIPALERVCADLHLDITRTTFLLTQPHAHARSPADVTYTIMALLHESPLPSAFQQALASLELNAPLNAESALTCLRAAAAAAHCALQDKAGRTAAPFRYFKVHEGTPEANIVNDPFWLSVACRWVSLAGGASQPLVASAPLPAQRCLVLAIPPRFQHETRNLFGAAFETAASRCGAAATREHFAPGAITLPAAHLPMLLDALTALLS